MPNKNHVTVSTKVPKEYAQILKETAQNKGISLGVLVKECITRYMETNEGVVMSDKTN